MRKKFVSFAFSLVFFTNAFAQVLVSRIDAQSYRGLVINEVKFNIEDAKKGVPIERSFKVLHDFQDANKKVTLFLRAADFTSDNVSGVPKFLPSGYYSDQASLASWIEFEKDQIVLDHYGQEEEVKFTINVPENAEPGGKYAAILLSDRAGEEAISEGTDSTSELGLSKELGPLILLTVEGEVTKDLSVDSLHTETIKGKKTNFFFSMPAVIVAKIKNNGNVHTAPTGVFYIYQGNDFQNYIAKFELNESRSNVLPNSTRDFTATWDDSFIYMQKEMDENGKEQYATKFDLDKITHLRIGKYKVKFMYMSDSTEAQGTTYQIDTSFWVIPWQLIALVAGLLALIILLILLRKLLSRNRVKYISKKQSGLHNGK